jgi:hypothetical protein
MGHAAAGVNRFGGVWQKWQQTAEFSRPGRV